MNRSLAATVTATVAGAGVWFFWHRENHLASSSTDGSLSAYYCRQHCGNADLAC